MAAGDLLSWHIYVLCACARTRAPVRRDAVIEALFAAGIGGSVLHPAAPAAPTGAGATACASDFPHSQKGLEACRCIRA